MTETQQNNNTTEAKSTKEIQIEKLRDIGFDDMADDIEERDDTDDIEVEVSSEHIDSETHIPYTGPAYDSSKDDLHKLDD